MIASSRRRGRVRLETAQHEVNPELVPLIRATGEQQIGCRPGVGESVLGQRQHVAAKHLHDLLENLEVVARLFGQDRKSASSNASSVLEWFGLIDVADRLVRTYSGGMRRKLDLGASLVGAPRLLLLDEPTTGLDPRSRIELCDAIRGLVAQGTDVLLTTQYLDEADNLASHVVIIDRGRVVADGTPSELKRRVGGKVIELHVRHEEDVVRVAHVLRRIDHGEVRIDQATHQVSVAVEGGGPELMSALRAVEEAGVEVEDVALRQPKLDEVFLALTGQLSTDRALEAVAS